MCFSAPPAAVWNRHAFIVGGMEGMALFIVLGFESMRSVDLGVVAIARKSRPCECTF